jgi:hypothetical protein
VEGRHARAVREGRRRRPARRWANPHQWARRVGGALFVNPGSIGLAYDRHVAEEDLTLGPVAEYALVFVDDLGLSVEFRRVDYPVEKLRDAIRSSGRPYADEFAAEWRGAS